MFVDTHCHLNLLPITENLDLMLEEARANGIYKWIVPSVHPDDWQRILELENIDSSIRPAFGIHPSHSSEINEKNLEELDKIAPQGVAIGETGLDKTLPDIDKQEWLFREQLRIAKRHSLPLLIHCRKAIGLTLQILKEEAGDLSGGIMHSFSGSLESALEFAKLGFAISVSGTITRKEAYRSLLIAEKLPLEQLVIETDAPYLTPSSHHTSPNRPAWLLDIALRLAAIRCCDIEKIAETTTANAKRFIPKL
jgi:TatD DNase family protein